MAYNAELQMLRELAHYCLPQMQCYFCQKPLMVQAVETFGHRRHPKVRVNITLHHINENRADNDYLNLAWAHYTCHRRFHKQLLIAAGRNNVTTEEG